MNAFAEDTALNMLSAAKDNFEDMEGDSDIDDEIVKRVAFSMTDSDNNTPKKRRSSFEVFRRFSPSNRMASVKSGIEARKSASVNPRFHVHSPLLAPVKSIMVKRQVGICCEEIPQPSPKPNKDLPKVSFAHTEVREYEQILGDNPSTRDGPPVSIGWAYDAEQAFIVTVDCYERTIRRHRTKQRNVSSWITADVIPRHRREDILLKAGYTQSQIAAAVRRNRKAHHQRRQTVVNLKASKMEEIVEGFFGRKNMKRFSWMHRKNKTGDNVPSRRRHSNAF
uniref:Uncharacterized protein n=1 Tax=Ditylum brightwellii TaxID=49249 RepID=A0A7S1VZK3_9STRA|mmetsp:Transcript_1138/g.1857  ORF Transcript_1138/g.1857 Transcript_1138/m.1857 type:complete len:280 (+) Transcript_1138:148-987(+)